MDREETLWNALRNSFDKSRIHLFNRYLSSSLPLIIFLHWRKTPHHVGSFIWMSFSTSFIIMSSIRFQWCTENLELSIMQSETVQSVSIIKLRKSETGIPIWNGSLYENRIIISFNTLRANTSIFLQSTCLIGHLAGHSITLACSMIKSVNFTHSE